jgi:RNA polymerase subunit RPABC4/transcription elongation factor Spt4
MIPLATMVRAKPAVKDVTCSACGAKYADEAWAALVLSRRIEPVEVQTSVLDWPDDLFVEVRACRSCQALMARTRGRRQRLT